MCAGDLTGQRPAVKPEAHPRWQHETATKGTVTSRQRHTCLSLDEQAPAPRATRAPRVARVPRVSRAPRASLFSDPDCRSGPGGLSGPDWSQEVCTYKLLTARKRTVCLTLRISHDKWDTKHDTNHEFISSK